MCSKVVEVTDRSPVSDRGSSGSIAGHVMWVLWWTKWHCGMFSPNISVSLANSHSTNCSTFIIM
jgi:hypothetical protein